MTIRVKLDHINIILVALDDYQVPSLCRGKFIQPGFQHSVYWYGFMVDQMVDIRSIEHAYLREQPIISPRTSALDLSFGHDLKGRTCLARNRRILNRSPPERHHEKGRYFRYYNHCITYTIAKLIYISEK